MSALSLRKSKQATTSTPPGKTPEAEPIRSPEPAPDVQAEASAPEPALPTLDAVAALPGAAGPSGAEWTRSPEKDEATKAEQPLGVALAAGPSAEPVDFELVYPDNRGQGAIPRPKFLKRKVSFGGYAPARAQVEAFLASTRRVEPRGKEDHSEVLERRVLDEVWSYAYTMLTAAHALHNLKGLAHAPEGSAEEAAQHTILLRRAERLMASRSRDYFALVENIDRVPGQLQTDTHPNASPRSELLAVLSLAESELGLRGKLATDLSSGGGGQGDARAARLARTFERRDAPRILAAFGSRCRAYLEPLESSAVAFRAKKGLPEHDAAWFEDAAKRVEALSERLHKAQEKAPQCPPIPGPMLDLLAELAKVKREHRALDAESRARSGDANESAEAKIGQAETVFKVSAWIAEQGYKLAFGPVAGHLVGIAAEAYRSVLLDKKNLGQNLLAQLISRGAGELVKGTVKTAVAGGLKQIGKEQLIGTSSEKMVQDLFTGAVKNIAKQTTRRLTAGASPVDAVTAALKATFSPEKIAELGVKSFIKAAIAPTS